MVNTNDVDRIVFVDWLRVFACFLVIPELPDYGWTPLVYVSAHVKAQSEYTKH